MRKSGGIIIYIVISILFVVGVMFALVWVDNLKRDDDREYIDSLFRDSRQSITFDSIRSVIDQRLTDSIRTIRAEIDVERSTRRRETQTIRRETQKLRHRLDSIGPINRPDL